MSLQLYESKERWLHYDYWGLLKSMNVPNKCELRFMNKPMKRLFRIVLTSYPDSFVKEHQWSFNYRISKRLKSNENLTYVSHLFDASYNDWSNIIYLSPNLEFPQTPYLIPSYFPIPHIAPSSNFPPIFIVQGGGSSNNFYSYSI